MLNDFYEKIEKILDKDITNNKTDSIMPEKSATVETKDNVFNFSDNNQHKLLTIPQLSKKQYIIIPETRTLIIDNKNYNIEPYFNLKNAIKGDLKTLDYIFTRKGFNINDFEIKEG